MNAFTKPEQQALFHLRRASNHRRSICANYARYTELKQQWIRNNPGASTAEYDIAIQRIARQCGV